MKTITPEANSVAAGRAVAGILVFMPQNYRGYLIYPPTAASLTATGIS